MPSIGLVLWLLLDPTSLATLAGATHTDGGFLGSLGERRQATALGIDPFAAAAGVALVLVVVAWCLRAAANAVLLCVLGELRLAVPEDRCKAPRALRRAFVSLSR